MGLSNLLTGASPVSGAQSGIDALEQVRSMMRDDLAELGLGSVLIVGGLAAVLLYGFRWKSRDPTLVSFGFFSLLYGIRLLTGPTMGFVTGIGEGTLRSLDALITYFILIPACFFFLDTVFKDLSIPRRPVATGIVVFYLAAAITDFGFGQRQVAMIANNILVILIFLLSLLALFWPRQTVDREIRVLRVGFTIFGLFALHSNLGAVGLVPEVGNLEPVGFVVLALTLGYVAAIRVVANQENLLAVQEELKMARQIQDSILPASLPQVRGVETAVRYVPMNSVAGDFYDFIAVDDKRAGMVIADVSGHGVPAALIASMFKVAFASQEAHSSEPARVLSGMNRILNGNLERQYVTAAYLYLDMEQRHLAYAAAGHPPMLLWRASAGRVEEIEQNGVILGVFADAAYTSVRLPFGPGDRCLLYTDGVIEAESPMGEFFGRERLRRFVEDNMSLPPERFCAALVERLDAWSERSPGQSPQDDITLLLMDFLVEEYGETATGQR